MAGFNYKNCKPFLGRDNNFSQRIPKAFGSTFAFAQTHKANPSAKPKEPLFANAPIRMVTLNIILTEKI